MSKCSAHHGITCIATSAVSAFIHGLNIERHSNPTMFALQGLSTFSNNVLGVALLGCAVMAFQLLARLWRERQEIREWYLLVRHLAAKGATNPGSNLMKALQAASGEHLSFVRMRVCGCFGPRMIFPRDEGLIAHITSNHKTYVRFNPVTSELSPLGRILCRAGGVHCYIQKYLSQSIWCNLEGPVHKRQKAVYNSYIHQAVTKVNFPEKAYQVAQAFFRDMDRKNENEFFLFQTIQKLNAALSLALIFDYKLTTCSLDRFVELANEGFGCIYRFQTPSQQAMSDMDELFQDMLNNSGDSGFVSFFQTAYEKGSLASEEEVFHNLVVAVFLGQQTLPHATFWPLARFATNPLSRQTVRADPDALAHLIAEEYRVHAPSTPLLMPYMALNDDQYGPLSIAKGSIFFIMPHLLHTNPRLWEDCEEYKVFRFSEAVRSRLVRKGDKEEDKKRTKMSTAGNNIVQLTTVHATLVSRTDPLDSYDRPTRKLPDRSSSSLQDGPKSNTKQRYIPFGVGRGICPAQKLGLTTVLNSIRALLDEWDLELVDDQGLLDKPLQEHILVDTISRPRNDFLVRLVPKKETEDGSSSNYKECGVSSVNAGKKIETEVV